MSFFDFEKFAQSSSEFPVFAVSDTLFPSKLEFSNSKFPVLAAFFLYDTGLRLRPKSRCFLAGKTVTVSPTVRRLFGTTFVGGACPLCFVVSFHVQLPYILAFFSVRRGKAVIGISFLAVCWHFFPHHVTSNVTTISKTVA